MPEWIEYEIGARGTVLEIRDSVGQAHGVDWVRGEIPENTARRLTLMWTVGNLPSQPDWWVPGHVAMRLTRLADGTVLVTGSPSYPKKISEVYHGRAICGG